MSGCDTVREILMDVARGAPAGNSLRAHLENCPACRRRLANERMLTSGLAASAVREVPPARIQAAVLQEFRKVHRPVPLRRIPVKWPVQWIALAAAAAILLVFFIAGRRHPAKIVATAAPPPHAPLAAQTLPVPVVPPVTAAAPKPARRRRAAKVQAPPAVEASEVATDFFEIPYTEPRVPTSVPMYFACRCLAPIWPCSDCRLPAGAWIRASPPTY